MRTLCVAASALLLLFAASPSLAQADGADQGQAQGQEVGTSSATAFYDELERLQHNITALHHVQAPSWVSAPNMRGTSSILYSCLLTLFACIYTALHLNIPERNASYLRILRVKCAWVFLALVAPEIVLYYASSQFIEARKVARTLRGIQREKEVEQEAATQDPDKEALCKFDLKYGFFISMGGAEMWVTDGDGKPILRTLSVDGVCKLAAHDIKPLQIPRSVILDRSKADTIQKALVLLQVGWMAVQCIARKAYGLPLTLLELHTMVHVVCAAAMYGFWFEKPLDLRSAEIIPSGPYDDFFNAIEYDKDKLFGQRTNIPGFETSWIKSGQTNMVADYMIERSLLFVLMTALPVAYGGVHLSAWNFEFPTFAEQVCWKVSGITIMAAMPAAFLAFLICSGVLLTHDFVVYAFSLTGLEEKVESVVKWVILNFFRVLVVVFMVARVYIVVEAFASLRAVPIGVYWTPAWVQMIPHV